MLDSNQSNRAPQSPESIKSFLENLYIRSLPPEQVMLLFGKQAILYLGNEFINQTDKIKVEADEVYLLYSDIYKIITYPK